MPHRWQTRLRFLALALATIVAIAPGAAAGPEEDAVAALSLTPAEMVAAFDNARLAGLGGIGVVPAITGDATLDAHIRALAEARGYQRRPEPSGPLVLTDGRALQSSAAQAWQELRAAAATAGHDLALTSGYRSVEHQRELWLERMTTTTTSALEDLLGMVAVPGYSKHHTGYAIDLRSGNAVLHEFATTPAYAWLSADGFANAMRHGWLPSYPAGVTGAGPDPEPWEFVYVGLDNILCAVFEPSAASPFCDTVGSTFAADITWLAANELTTGCDPIRFCTDDLVTRGQAATFLWRLSGRPVATAEIDFTDVAADAYYAEPVRWMVQNGITTGTSPQRFDPSSPLTREQFVTFLWRAAGRPVPPAPHTFDDVIPGGFAEAAIAWAANVGITTGTAPNLFSPTSPATRGQTAAFLHRYAPLLVD